MRFSLECSHFFLWFVKNIGDAFFFIILALVLLLMHFYSNYRGPSSGSKGKVILLFEDNPMSKVGVRFDKPIPDGVDLGGLCEVGHGFFCNGTFHRTLKTVGFCNLFVFLFVFSVLFYS